MSNLLEITGDDIAQLNDADLRALVGLLCEADFRMAHLSTRGVTWGGNQDARDGGLDVVVRGDIEPPPNSFVPRKNTGFQVKKPDMPRAEILKEMKPDGVLREEIKKLIEENGAYIIVSSNGSTANTALNNRLDAMKEAVQGEADYANLCLDFFDRGRIATWLRSHPSLILWTRRKIGRQLRGWRPYENWVDAPEGIEEEYLLDDGLRLHDGGNARDKGMSAKDGLQKLRSLLSGHGASIRLTGLSGVGKTRLVQALFDERVGEGALNRTQVLYTDMSYGPEPDPTVLAEQLISDRARAILIVDNCPPDLHRRLTKICSGATSTVSLLTVEYDVRDYLPEETNVLRLEPASEGVIEKLIQKRFAHIGQIDSRTIAEFSGGNARMAIALANTVEQGETLSGFRDEELFKRLFYQRHNPNENLLISAEACSLVYSFEGTDATSEKSELKFLASLIGKSGSDLYRDVETLKQRDLVQSRDVWRAVLPHAIANRLARRALASIPRNTIVQSFLQSESERLIKSFTRRLAYLHDCGPAVEIVNDWLKPDGWIGKANCNFNPLGLEVFTNIAPVSPEKTLEAINRAANGENGAVFASRQNPQYNEFVRLLRQLAYEPELFKSSVELICRFALSEDPNENRNSTRDALKSLFYIHLSGTLAPMDMRAEIITELSESADQDKQELAVVLLSSALETWHFSSSHDFTFGARPRDFGYYPETREEVVRWFETFVGICRRLALSGEPISQKAKRVLCEHLRGLWTNASIFDALEDSIKQIHQQQVWNEAWIAVREIIKYDSKDFEKEAFERLQALERLLRPNDLLERARTFALSDENSAFTLEDDFETEEDPMSGWKKMQETTQEIAAQVVQDAELFNGLLPELVTTHNTRIYSFGRGLAYGCDDKMKVWELLCVHFKNAPPEKRQLNLLTGFLSLCSESDQAFYDSVLDSLINEDVLGEWFPIFQMISPIDRRGIERLHAALDTGNAKIQTFQYLAWGRNHEPISDDELADLLRKILSKEEGIGVVIEILKMRFFMSKRESRKYSENLLLVARKVLSAYSFPAGRKRHGGEDFDLEQIACICLDGKEGVEAATQLCRRLCQAIAENAVFVFDYPGLLSALARTQPMVFLDEIVGNNDIKDYQRRRMFADGFERRSNPIDAISDDDLISWCDRDPESRYPLIASMIQPFSKAEKEDKLEWKRIVLSIFEKAPRLEKVLGYLSRSIRPSGWSGSLANVLEKRLILFQSLYEHHNAEIRAWAKSQCSALQESIKQEREWEEARERKRNESFE